MPSTGEEELNRLYELLEKIKDDLKPFEHLRDLRHLPLQENELHTRVVKRLGEVRGRIAELENDLDLRA